HPAALATLHKAWPALQWAPARRAAIARLVAGRQALRWRAVRPETLLREPRDGVCDTASQDSTASSVRHVPSAECDDLVRTARCSRESDSSCLDAEARAVTPVESSVFGRRLL